MTSSLAITNQVFDFLREVIDKHRGIGNDGGVRFDGDANLSRVTKHGDGDAGIADQRRPHHDRLHDVPFQHKLVERARDVAHDQTAGFVEQLARKTREKLRHGRHEVLEKETKQQILRRPFNNVHASFRLQYPLGQRRRRDGQVEEDARAVVLQRYLAVQHRRRRSRVDRDRDLKVVRRGHARAGEVTTHGAREACGQHVVYRRSC